MATSTIQEIIKSCSGTLPNAANSSQKVCDYPTGETQTTFKYLSYEVNWWDGGKHCERPDIVIVLESDGIYAICTSSDPLRSPITIFYA